MAMRFPLWSSSSDSNYSSNYESGLSGDETPEASSGFKFDLSYNDLDSALLEANLQDCVDSKER